MLEIRFFSPEELVQIYHERMVEDFPADEIKKLDMMQDLIRKRLYEPYGVYEKGELVAYALFSKDGFGREIYLLDFFSVKKELRGKGYGSKLITYFLDHYKEANALLVEVENPFLESSSSEQKIKLDRMNFYLHRGWIDTKQDVRNFDVDYRILRAPIGKRSGPEEVREDYASIYKSFISKEELAVEMHFT